MVETVNKIIINADDFGLNESCTKAIVQAFSENLISSTTAMANGEFIEQAFTLAQENGFLDKVGIHINITEGTPLTENIKSDAFFCENGKFHGRINRLKKPEKSQLAELKEEVTAQIERLKGIGFEISHADSHHHIHTDVYFEDTIKEVLFRFNVNKIRLHRNIGKIKFYKRIVKNIFNKTLKQQGFITTDKMGSMEDLALYPDAAQKGVCEIMVHPDFDKNGRLIDRQGWDDDGYAFGEELEDIKKYLTGLKLVSYKELQ